MTGVILANSEFRAMSSLGQKSDLGTRSVLPPRTDIERPLRHARFVPETDIVIAR
jgi:hypothetical protein